LLTNNKSEFNGGEMMKSQMRWLIGILVISLVTIHGCQDMTSVSEVAGVDDDVLASHERARGVANAVHPVLNFRSSLKGENEVPAVETNAQGQAIFQVNRDRSEMKFKVIVANIENVHMAHIHLGQADENGPVVVWLYPEGPPPQVIEGRFQGTLAEGVITADNLVGMLAGSEIEDLIEEIRAGNTYVNVHTTQNPPGEIRGQIE
jgi:hypothetical protein